jgi:serine/threonine protein kinase
MQVVFQENQIINNQYKLLEKLGFGGFSEVWKAQDLRIPEPQPAIFAIKIFIRQDQEGIELCKQEYLRTHNLNHPHVLTTLSFGVHDSAPYLVMPYCAGGTVMSQTGEWSELQIADFIAQVGSGLDYIHNLPTFIIHNDIKLDNFLINEAGQYLLSDFSISQRLQLKLTRSLNSGLLQGHPSGAAPMAYRPPESFKYKAHERQEPVKASDIWAFGSSLYLMATGELPFPMGGGMAQLTAMDNPTVKIGDVIPELPKQYSSQLEAIIQMCLSLETWDRPQAKELVEWAQHYQRTGSWWEEKEVIPVIPEIPEASELPLTPKRSWKGAAAIGLVALIGGGGYYKMRPSEVKPIDLVVTPVIPPVSGDKPAPIPSQPPPPKPNLPSVTVVDHPIPSPDPKTNTENSFSGNATAPQPSKPIQQPIPVPVSNSKVFTNPSSNETPNGIQIARVELTATETKVSCYIPYTDEKQKINLFSSANPESAFYLRGSDRKKYELKGVNGISFGEHIKVPQGGLKFSLFFAPLPLETKQFDMREGMDQTMTNSSYWNFIGIQLK